MDESCERRLNQPSSPECPPEHFHARMRALRFLPVNAVPRAVYAPSTPSTVIAVRCCAVWQIAPSTVAPSGSSRRQ
jgi:hypothetical protein